MATKTRVPKDLFGLLDYLNLQDMTFTENEIGARCPMHLKRTGALENRPVHWFINRVTGLHHCFSCGYRGNLIKLVMDVSKLDMYEALRKVREFGIDLAALTELPDYKAEPEEEAPTFKPDMNIFSTEIPARMLTKRRIDPRSAYLYGVRWDCEQSRWILPIYSPTGDLWGYQAKAEGGAVINYPRKVHKSYTLFGLHKFEGFRLILVESPLDVVYMHRELDYQTVASFGSAISDAQLKLIVGAADELVLALDNDASGIKETRRILTEKWHRRIPTRIFHYPKGRKDPGEMSEIEILRGINEAVPATFWRET